MTQETKSALLIGFIFIMIVLVVVVDGFDTGRTPALNDAPTDEMTIVPPAEDDSFQRSQPPASGQIETASAQVERYEVKRGDTMSGICAEYYGDANLYRALEDANGLEKNSILVPGQTISLPPRAALASNRQLAAPPPQTAQPEQPAPKETVRKNRTYTVQKGDMGERIARRELGDGRRWMQIFEMNRDQLSSPDDFLQPGMVLRLPE